MEKKLGKQLTIYIVLLAIVWTLILVLQIRLAKRVYSHQKDLFAVKLTHVFEDALTSVETVDYEALDSLVCHSLNEHDIPYPYDLGVYNDDEEVFLFLTENADVNALLVDGFRYKLVLVTDKGTHLASIILHFPSLVKKFRREMVSGYVVIGLLLLLLLCCFVNFFYIILKHRKINIFREKMAHFITHEVRTPLTTINLSTQMLRDDSLTIDKEARNSYLDMITEETKVLETLVNEVLTVFKLKNVAVEEKSDVEMHKLLQEVCKVYGPQLDECQAKVHCDFQADVDLVSGNYIHLFNAFSNLVDNAIKYRKDPLQLGISTRNTDKGIEVRVADNGIGISKENLSFIFEPFARFNTENAHYVKGFGVGLNYVKHIVEFHKGTVNVESKLGEGTVFIVNLPLKNI